MSKKNILKIERKTNPRIINLIFSLKCLGNEKKSKLWISIAKKLMNPSKNYSSINLSKINRYTNKDETIIVPGKVLGSGYLNHSLTIASLGFSESAVKKIESMGGKCITIEELMEINPNGNNIKILQ